MQLRSENTRTILLDFCSLNAYEDNHPSPLPSSKILSRITIGILERDKIIFVCFSFFFWRFWMKIEDRDWHPKTLEVFIEF
jgi:hypothetical protein